MGAAQTKTYCVRGTPAEKLLRWECVDWGLGDGKEQLHKLITHGPLPSSLHSMRVVVPNFPAGWVRPCFLYMCPLHLHAFISTPSAHTQASRVRPSHPSSSISSVPFQGRASILPLLPGDIPGPRALSRPPSCAPPEAHIWHIWLCLPHPLPFLEQAPSSASESLKRREDRRKKAAFA